MPHLSASSRFRQTLRTLLLASSLAACASAGGAAPSEQADVLIKGGTIYDGGTGKPYVGDVALKGDRIVYAGRTAPMTAARVLFARPTQRCGSTPPGSTRASARW